MTSVKMDNGNGTTEFIFDGVRIKSVNFEKKTIIVKSSWRDTRITGTKLSAILGKNPYKSAFEQACEWTQLVKVVEDSKQIKFGELVEDRIRQKVREMINKIDLGMKGEMGIEDPVPKKQCGYEHFPGAQPFGGLVDGYVTCDGKRCAILEIKTAGNVKGWTDGNGNFTNVPENYVYQASLYANLANLDKIVFAVAFVNEEDYKHPEQWVPTENNIRIIVTEPKNLEEDMGEACEWFNMMEETKMLPPWTDSERDQAIVKGLCETELKYFSEEEDQILRYHIIMDNDESRLDLKKMLETHLEGRYRKITCTYENHRFTITHTPKGNVLEEEVLE